MSKLIDLTGQTFGRLTVIERSENDKWNNAYWRCKCFCGNIYIAQGRHLRSGFTKSCGCLRIEKLKKRNMIHGMTNTPEFNSWQNMLARCQNPNNPNFKDYGDRGIKVCDEWKNDFMAFFNYVGKKPSAKHSIDRIDNNGNYEPGNVRWATRTEQANNIRNNHKITFHHITMNLAQWAKFVGINSKLIGTRLNRGWPIEKAIFQPINKMNK